MTVTARQPLSARPRLHATRTCHRLDGDCVLWQGHVQSELSERRPRKLLINSKLISKHVSGTLAHLVRVV